MSAHESLETELKFDVDAATAPPDLAGLVPGGGADAPVHHELVATYLDTAGHDLATRKITLRRRTGGTDAGWHLKRPGETAIKGVTARRELQVSFDEAPADGPVPGVIMDAITAIVRDRELIPVATITNERTVTVVRDADGASLAEFCADQVLAHAQQSGRTSEWAEWEFELTGGGRSLLKQARTLLRQAGARPASSESKLARALGTEPHTHRPARLRPGSTGLDLVVHALAGHRDALLTIDPQVRLGTEDAVHQLRVTTRKLRSVLTSYPQVLAPEPAATVIAELTELAGLASAARDLEVQVEINTELLAGEHAPDELRRVLIDDEQRRQERALRSLQFALTTRRYLSLLDAVDELIGDPQSGPDAQRPAEKVARDGVDHARTRLHKAERKLRKLEPWSPDWVQQVHRIRKRAKTVRYTAESAAPVGGKRARRAAREASQIQKHLGLFQDTVVNRERIAQIAASTTLSAESQFVLGRLDAREEARGRAAVDAYLKARR
ncbi:CHAD domain-containing protein [Gordonia sp. VNK21]|uniref:CYTH and CHAD domain-containing protein n=1 Tax=Gordonia sp. VNK21 TaxID=3382483 RepID=UPI0038D39DA5